MLDEIFYWDFASWTVHFVNICVKNKKIHELFIQFINYVWWHAVVQWLRHCATNRKVAGSILDGVRIFHWHNPSGPGVDSASNRNEYQECFLGVKAAGAQGWQPCHLHVPIVMKSGSLNLLEPSGPVKACNGIALPLPTCFGVALPSSGSVPSTFWEKPYWGEVDRISWMGVLCLVTWCVAIWDRHVLCH
jgi:hypothetical protein